ncbi:NAD-dependent DNA ligase LigA [Halostella pelagica]|uniref:NAD-dependent DNA ligase LigA n=1 Tax=Halostella pelagica TaxID=2583824 RepID=UPI0010816B74|nr:NAD-dependent DNA ligase LigA [Halostella pelagica]
MSTPDLEDNPYVRDPPTDFDPVSVLAPDEAREQAAQLREAIRHHDRRYYVENDPVIADRTYDALFARLEALEDEFDLQTEDSPTRRVGGEPVDEFDAVTHVAPMLSIDQSGDEEDVREFDRRVREEVDGDGPADLTYVCEPKFDGVSIEVVYEDGGLVRAATRGDGREGDDVTRNVRTIGAIPQRLRGDHPDFLAVRGEVYMPRDAFQQYNSERVERGKEPFANPRNATAGTIRQQDPAVVAERPLSCFFFEVLDSSDEWPTRWAEHGAFPEFGLPVTDLVERVDDIDDAIDYRERMVDARDDLNYEIDGVVIKVDDREKREMLGATARHYRWAFAYKFPPRNERTTVRDVAVQVGRTGRLTPVALLDPVDVGGVTVSRASLHNPDEIAEKNVNVGDEVRVERAGDVIPYVEEVTDKRTEGHYEFPDACPVCDSPVERDGPMAFCTGGLACAAQLRRAVEYYASDDGLDIDGLGERSVRQFVEAGLIEDSIADLYGIEKADLLELERWGERSAENLLAELAGTKEPPLPEFLSALGIPGVGPATARELARAFGTLDDLLAADENELREVPDVGPTVAAQMRDFFDSEANQRALDELREHGVDPRPYEAETGEKLDGLTFVFTGALEGYTRSEAEELVERHGANATGSVSGNTDYLVAGESPGATKVSDAEAVDVPVLDENEFENLLDERGVAER